MASLGRDLSEPCCVPYLTAPHPTAPQRTAFLVTRKFFCACLPACLPACFLPVQPLSRLSLSLSRSLSLSPRVIYLSFSPIDVGYSTKALPPDGSINCCLSVSNQALRFDVCSSVASVDRSRSTAFPRPAFAETDTARASAPQPERFASWLGVDSGVAFDVDRGDEGALSGSRGGVGVGGGGGGGGANRSPLPPFKAADFEGMRLETWLLEVSRGVSCVPGIE